jgi:hypothetical protein
MVSALCDNNTTYLTSAIAEEDLTPVHYYFLMKIHKLNPTNAIEMTGNSVNHTAGSCSFSVYCRIFGHSLSCTLIILSPKIIGLLFHKFVNILIDTFSYTFSETVKLEKL